MAKERLSIFNKLVFFTNNLAAIALLTSYCAWFINPSSIPLMGIIGLGVPILMLVNFLFVLYWILLRKRQFFLSTICLAAGWWHFNALYQFTSGNNIEEAESSLRVMSYNVHNYYPAATWKYYVPKEEMAKLVIDANPDVLCMQEFQKAKNWVPKYLKYKSVSKFSSAQLAIFSRYKIVHSEIVEYPNKRNGYDIIAFADILKDGDTVRIINIHLASISLDNKDLQTFTKIEKVDKTKLEKSGKQIFKLLLKGYKKRGIQANAIADFIKTSPYPVILCGDLNDTPTSYSYKTLTSELEDSYKLAGSGLGTTHPRFDAYKIPMRIDHIMASESLIPFNWHLIKSNNSDHYPVIVDYVLPAHSSN